MTKKLICLLTVGALVFSLFACNGGGGSTVQSGTAGAAAATTAGVSTTAAKILPAVTSGDYGGYNFRFYTKGPICAEWANADIYAEAETGEAINDAVYKRNTYIEQQFNIKISDIPCPTYDVASPIDKSVKAGSDDFDVMTPSMLDSAILAVKGDMVDLKTMPGIDLSQIWWDQRANADLSIAGKLPFTVSDLFIMDKDATWLIIFNKQLLQDLALDNPYTLVANNTWTFDKFLSMEKGVSKDVNGDGKMDENDFYGSMSQGENMTAFYLASGERFTTKDANDIPSTAMDTPRSDSVISKIYELMYDPTISYNYWDITPQTATVWQVCTNMFENNQAVFYITALQLVVRMRNMETNFGIVPMPKYEASQPNYLQYAHPVASAISVPVTGTDLKRTGIILEALTAESEYTVRPAYFEKAIDGKYLRDTESIGMLDIIFANRVFDLAPVYVWNGLGTILEDMYRNKHSTDFTSLYAKKKTSFETAIQKTVDAFSKLS